MESLARNGVELTKAKTFDRIGGMINKIKQVGKSSVVFTRLYGRAAYEAWKARDISGGIFVSNFVSTW